MIFGTLFSGKSGVSSDQTPCYFLYIGDYITQLNEDFNKPLQGSQYIGMS